MRERTSWVTSPTVWSLGVLVVGAVADLVVGDAGYVPRNLALTVLVLVLAHRAGWGARDLGLARATVGAGVRWGMGAVVVVGVVVLIGVALADVVEVVGALLDDRRAQLSGTGLVAAVLVRIPLGTVLFEEVLFRGVLLTAFLERTRPLVAEVVSSAIFGLWHVAPTIVALQVNDVSPWSVTGVGAIVGAVLATTAWGVVACRLRRLSGSLVAPMLAHWATNAFALGAASVT